MKRLQRRRAVEFPDRQAYRRRQRRGAMIALYAVGLGLLAWGGQQLYRDAIQSRQRDAALAPPPRKPAPAPRKPAPPDPAVTRAARMDAIRGAMRRGDEIEIQRQIDALQNDFRKSMRFAAPDRVAAYETARLDAWKVAGVRSLTWLDGGNLYVVVDSLQHRNQATLDALCRALPALGDKPDVVIDLQVDYRNREEVDLLSRNCNTPATAAPTDPAAPAPPAADAPANAPAAAASDDEKAKAADEDAPDPVREDSLRILKDSTPEM